jgi:hypothetical protein
VDKLETDASGNGWLHGCSVGPDGVVWEGQVAKPYRDVYSWQGTVQSTMSYSFPGPKYGFAKGALVGLFHCGTSESSYPAVLAAIHVSGDKFKVHYLKLALNTKASELVKPEYACLLDNGMVVLSYYNTRWDGTATSGYITPVLRLTEDALTILDATYTYQNLSAFEPFNQVALHGSDWCRLLGLDGSGRLVKQTYSEKFSHFLSPSRPTRGSRRYQLRITSDTGWWLRDIEANMY